MEPDSSHAVTRALNAIAAGDPSADPALFDSIYAELRAMAAGKMAGERPEHTLQATALVHEAFLRLAGNDSPWENRRHFFGAAAEAMRRILVDSARRRKATKRGPDTAPLPLDPNLPAPPGEADERLLQVHDALDALEAEDPLKARIVKLRFFAGLHHQEIGALLDLNEKTVRRHWELAKVILYRIIRDSTAA